MKITLNSTSRKSLVLSLIILSLVSNVGIGAESKERDPNRPGTVKNPYAKDDKVTIIKPKPGSIGKKLPGVHKPIPGLRPMPVKTKRYKVPGSVAIGAAKRHGYNFGVDMQSVPRGCKFVGNHWQIPAKSYCGIIGFESRINKCKMLRKGWTLHKMELTNFDPRNQRTNSYDLPGGNYPTIKLFPNNRQNKTKVITVGQVILEGPDGPFKNFEEAFSHCDETGYRP